MSDRSKVVLGIFKTREDIETAINALKAGGFTPLDISVLLPSSSASEEFLHTKSTKAPEGAATGAGTGAVIGGALGFLAGLGALTIPGLGAFIVAGPIMSTLAGLGVGGAIGGISGALIGMGFPEFEAKLYESHIKKGGFLLSVHADLEQTVLQAKDILKRAGGQDITSTTEAKGDLPKRKGGASATTTQP